MKTFSRIVSWIALAGTLLPALLFLAGRIELSAAQWWMLVATVMWFVATPVWMERDASGSR